MSPHLAALVVNREVAMRAGLILAFQTPKGHGRPVGKKNQTRYGALKDLARRYLAGEFGERSIVEVAEVERVPLESFRTSIARVRREEKGRARR